MELDTEGVLEEPKVGMTFNTSDEVYMYYSGFAKQNGFEVAKRTSRKGDDGKLQYITIECNKAGKARARGSNSVRQRSHTKVGCPAHVNASLSMDGKWRLILVVLDHNHERSQGKSLSSESNREIDEGTEIKLELSDLAEIILDKTSDTFQNEVGEPNNPPCWSKDCRSYLVKTRHLQLVEGDATELCCYFMKMKADNENFFYAMDLNDKGRLRNVFWADARSRAACKEFGDVVKFDTTYLVNMYGLQFATFVSVNHHGHLILLGCALICHEDIESFSWLFQTWMTCMWGCAPKTIITDRCTTIKNAIENVFPNSLHHWCIWQIMKKVPEQLSRYKDYEKISWCMQKTVYDSLTVEEFKSVWNTFIMEYVLESNTWLTGLYLERERWVPAYIKDVFWAGMSSTQLRENMKGYFDDYIDCKTTLKQFVEQYESILTKKVEIEKEADMKSWNSFINCITNDELEKQFVSVYTNDKVREFHEQFWKKMQVHLRTISRNEYELLEWITFGEGEERKKKRVSFKVLFNAETNDADCTCRLFEFTGMVCAHQLTVWNNCGVERVPDKFVFKRWCKNVKRDHARIQISYNKFSIGIEARRHENMCNLFKEVANLAEDSQKKYETVMTRGRELKRELLEPLDVDGTTHIRYDSCSFADEAVPSGQSRTILDPEN